ncbi:DNA-binding NarL/FixJ family response regulator [Microbacterium sp. SORGH_AS428]|uniref:response regulator transcription factor n=1 Tax=Microbacterium sp. SORGH_AS_0428 TaxID=3041788 RepID=UPI0028572DCF|nr:response regulator transcription factor [Microbacterium sp. SORGH_AS_0428]MDR6198266.1 DNA-binding NarL/FixJ family response regulator [Microbacterium sp. SORGH_AS_0428]
MNAPVRILLVDDQELIRLGFRMVLDAEDDLQVVGEAADGESAVAAVGALQPHVVLMDVRMPGVDGITATERIVAAHPDARVLVLTTFDLDEYAFAALRAGASGFLLKDAQRHELISAIHAVHRGDATLSPRVTRRMIELLGTPPVRSAAPDPTEALTEREREVFLAMAQGATNAEIAAALFLGESTVKTHVGRILAKLGARDRVQAVVIAHRAGLVDGDGIQLGESGDR